ncbi:phage anti-RecBCD protein, partial [Salmonella sp. 741265084_PSA]|uniref:phage anti-RecBCD protein n=1 Tax=Salmonella sp. 741265084_PSA TaxID=3389008 RepID=UPI003980294D
MPAPLYGADDPRNCSGSSKSEVLENIKNNLDAFLALPPETKADKRQYDKTSWHYELDENGFA